jgi:hypothetical protein
MADLQAFHLPLSNRQKSLFSQPLRELMVTMLPRLTTRLTTLPHYWRFDIAGQAP